MDSSKTRVDFRNYSFDVEFPVKAFMNGTYYLPVPETEELTYMHFHNSIELGYCHSGDGNLFVDDRRIPFHSGDMVIVMPYVTHIAKAKYIDGVKQPLSCEYLYFDTQILRTIFHSSAFYSMLNGLNKQKASFMILPRESNPAIADHMLAVLDELRNKRPNYQLYILGLIFTICLDLSRANPGAELRPEQSGVQSDGNAMLAIFPAIEYIHKHYAEPIDVQILADMCYMSLTHFRRVFRGIMHTSPLDYIHHERIMDACRLLYSSELSVLEICYQTGFNTVSCFNRQFISEMGVPPLKWKTQARTHGNGRPFANI